MCEGVLLLILGPSGVGKSTLINILVDLDNRFLRVPVLMTRALRVGELGKVSVTREQLDDLDAAGELVLLNHLYGVSYGTPGAPIADALSKGHFPVIDWPINRVPLMRNAFPGRAFSVYIRPPSAMALRRRLSLRGEPNRARLRAGLRELRELKAGAFGSLVDCCFASQDGQQGALARNVLDNVIARSAEGCCT